MRPRDIADQQRDRTVGAYVDAVAERPDSRHIEHGDARRSKQRVVGRDLPGGQRRGKYGVERALLGVHHLAVEGGGVDGRGHDLLPRGRLPGGDLRLGDRDFLRGYFAVA